VNADTEAEARRLNGLALKKALGFYFAMGAGIALLVPESVAASLPLIRSATDLLGEWIPAIGRYAMVSPFPETMRLYMLAMWLGLPFAIYRLTCSWTFSETLLNLRFLIKLKTLGLILIGLAIAGYFIVFFFDVSRESVLHGSGRGGLMVRTLTQTRIGLACFGNVIFCIVAMLAAITVRLVHVMTLGGKSSSVDSDE
jgi:hypothetical protein